MADERAAARGWVARLRAELQADLPVISSLGAQVAAAADVVGSEADAALLALWAVRVHRYYTAIEGVLQRIERAHGAEPTGADWHLELLTGAALELPDLRPAILPQDVVDDLREVLRFRHFFRHAYAVELDGQKLAAVMERVGKNGWRDAARRIASPSRRRPEGPRTERRRRGGAPGKERGAERGREP